MLFRNPEPGGEAALLAISQPAHAVIAETLLAYWHAPLDPAVLLAAGQHDIAWLDWERAPTIDPTTRRPHRFTEIGAAVHAPMWQTGVARALAAWGRLPALLISRHGSLIYRRLTDRHRLTAADAAAASRFLAEQAAPEAAWAASLGVDAATLEHATGLIAFADQLSLVACGAFDPPPRIAVGGLPGGADAVAVRRIGRAADWRFSVDPWPFRSATVAIRAEALRVPPDGLDEGDAVLRWLNQGERLPLDATLVPE